jgi:hypothetical protein
MRGEHPSTIMGSGMTAPREPIEEARRPGSAPRVLAICGDPVVGQALVLLLRGSLYDTRFLRTSSLSEPGSLQDVGLLLLTPMWESNTERREALLASLRGASSTAETPILELTTSSKASRNGGARVRPEHMVPWPCSPEELERRIQTALRAGPGRADDPPRHA